MARDYYNENDPKYPTIVKEILRRIRLYILDILYPNEHYDDAKKRFIIGDISGRESVYEEAIAIFQKSTNLLPFTIYNFSDVNEGDSKSTLASSGKMYSETLGVFIAQVQKELEVNMISFFADVSDYLQALSRLYEQNATMVRLKVPIIINGTQTWFPIDIKFEPAKGSYAFEFQEMLTSGNIYDISHSFLIKYWHFYVYSNFNKSGLIEKPSVLDKDITDPSTLTPSTGDRYIVPKEAIGVWSGHDEQIAQWNGSEWLYSYPQDGWVVYVEDESKYYIYNYDRETDSYTWTLYLAPISPVDDMSIAVKETDEDGVDSSSQYASVPETPAVNTVSPADLTTNVAIDSNIVITFVTAMNPDSVEENLSIYPAISADYSWNEALTELTINPIINLDNDTVYTVEIIKTALGGYPLQTLFRDYKIQFTTVA